MKTTLLSLLQWHGLKFTFMLFKYQYVVFWTQVLCIKMNRLFILGILYEKWHILGFTCLESSWALVYTIYIGIDESFIDLRAESKVDRSWPKLTYSWRTLTSSWPRVCCDLSSGKFSTSSTIKCLWLIFRQLSICISVHYSVFAQTGQTGP